MKRVHSSNVNAHLTPGSPCGSFVATDCLVGRLSRAALSTAVGGLTLYWTVEIGIGYRCLWKALDMLFSDVGRGRWRGQSGGRGKTSTLI